MYNSNNKDDTVSISLRAVNKNVWRDFKKLAVINDMTMQDYLKFLVQHEMAKIDIKRSRVESKD